MGLLFNRRIRQWHIHVHQEKIHRISLSTYLNSPLPWVLPSSELFARVEDSFGFLRLHRTVSVVCPWYSLSSSSLSDVVSFKKKKRKDIVIYLSIKGKMLCTKELHIHNFHIILRNLVRVFRLHCRLWEDYGFDSRLGVKSSFWVTHLDKLILVV